MQLDNSKKIEIINNNLLNASIIILKLIYIV